MNDNIDARYQFYKEKPEALKRALVSFHRLTEETYSTFCDVLQEHSDIGKAAVVIMAMNYASHIFKNACDETKDKKLRIKEITEAIAPMYDLLYDRLTRESIDELENISISGESQK